MEYLTCRVSGDRYGLPLEQVREIVGTVPITRVPGAPPALRGLVGHRGNPLPVLDLAVRLGFPETAVGRRSCLILVEATCEGAPLLVGMLVDGVDRIASVDRTRGAMPPSLESLANEGVCTGFGEVDGRLVPLLDPEALLRLEALRRARPRAVASRPASDAREPSRAAPRPVPDASAPAQGGSPPAPRPSTPGAAPAACEAREPSGDVRASGGSASGGRPRTAVGERRPRREEAARRPAETPRVGMGAAAPRPAPDASAFSGPGNGPWAAPLAPAARREAPLSVPTATSPAAGSSHASWTPGILAAVGALVLLVGGALAVRGWRELSGSDSRISAAPAPAPAMRRAPAPAMARAPAPARASASAPAPARAESRRTEAGAARERARAVEPRPPEAEPSGPPAGDERIHEVRRGDSLWRISRRYLHDPERWPAIYERNRDQIADPDLIEPRQRLIVPGEAPPVQGR